MGVIGFSFNKIDAEKKAAPGGKIEVKHNVSWKNVEETSVSFGSENKGFVKIEYDFDIVYGEDYGKISFSGEVIYSDTKEIISEIVKEYESSKKLPENVSETILKFVFDKCVLKALNVAEDLKLPHPVPLRFNLTGNKNKKS